MIKILYIPFQNILCNSKIYNVIVPTYIIKKMVNEKKAHIIFIILRISLALIFLWAFFDKLLGLGFATKPENAWILGKSPTIGFLSNAVHGPFKEVYNSIAGNLVVDWLFMIGLLFIGLSLLFGIFMNLACYSGALMMFLMWTSLLPPENHPFLDDHVIYLLALIILKKVNAGDIFGLGKKWKKIKLIKEYKIFQ